MSHRFAIFVLIVQVILWIGHAILYAAAVAFLPVPASIAAIVIALMSVTFVTANLLAFRSDNLLVRVYYLFASVWLGTGLYLLFASVLAGILCAITTLLSIEIPIHWFGYFALAAGGAMALYSLINARTLRVSRYEVKLTGLPESWRGRRAVWASDIHLGHINRVGYSRMVAKKIESLRPDIVFIGGDLFDGVDFQAKELLAPLAGVKASLGMFFITGNHEEFGDPMRFVGPIREAGMRVLDNEKVDINGVQIVGVDYARTTSRESHARVLERIGIDRSKPSVLLMHSPSHLDISETAGVSLQISGHTHRGQLLPFSRITKRVYHGFDYGLKRLGEMQVITSSGAGTWGPPMRSGSPTEVVLIEFV